MQQQELLKFAASLTATQRDQLGRWLTESGDHRPERERLKAILAMPEVFDCAAAALDYVVLNAQPANAKVCLQPFIGSTPDNDTLDELVRSYLHYADKAETALRRCRETFGPAAWFLADRKRNVEGFTARLSIGPLQYPARIYEAVCRVTKERE